VIRERQLQCKIKEIFTTVTLVVAPYSVLPLVLQLYQFSYTLVLIFAIPSTFHPFFTVYDMWAHSPTWDPPYPFSPTPNRAPLPTGFMQSGSSTDSDCAIGSGHEFATTSSPASCLAAHLEPRHRLWARP
jgi:hypothetical protein